MKDVQDILNKINKERDNYYLSSSEEYTSGDFTANVTENLIEIVEILMKENINILFKLKELEEEVKDLKLTVENYNKELNDLWNKN